MTTAALAITVACSPSVAHRGDPSPAAPPSDQGRGQTIDHLLPARDSVSVAPPRFTWTPIQGADEYSIGVWNEVDQLVWRQNHIPTTSVTRPEDVPLEPGTYFWSISALREGQQIGESGLAAFVVRTIP